MRLIDADALIESLSVDPIACMGCPEPEWLEELSDILDTAPSIEVIRCYECRWRNDYGCHNPIWGDGWANYPSPNPRADDFCSYGERRK